MLSACYQHSNTASPLNSYSLMRRPVRIFTEFFLLVITCFMSIFHRSLFYLTTGNCQRDYFFSVSVSYNVENEILHLNFSQCASTLGMCCFIGSEELEVVFCCCTLREISFMQSCTRFWSPLEGFSPFWAQYVKSNALVHLLDLC